MNNIILKDGSYAQGFYIPEDAIIVPSPPPTKAHTWDRDKSEWVFAGFTDERIMSELRMERNRRLSTSDWMANSDVTMSNAWKTYRQELRDLPSTSSPTMNEAGELTNVTWPTKPKE